MAVGACPETYRLIFRTGVESTGSGGLAGASPVARRHPFQSVRCLLEEGEQRGVDAFVGTITIAPGSDGSGERVQERSVETVPLCGYGHPLTTPERMVGVCGRLHLLQTHPAEVDPLDVCQSEKKMAARDVYLAPQPHQT